MRYVKCLLAMAVVPLMLCAGCSSLADSNSTDENTTVSVKETKAVPDKVELKKYEFPVFLKDIKKNDALCSEVYASFYADTYMIDVTTQPFKDYECTDFISNSLYVFKDGKFKGLLDTKGEVVLEADTYTEIVPCSYNMLVMSKDKEQGVPDDFYTFTDEGSIKKTEPPEFDQRAVFISKSVSEENEGKEVFNIEAGGKTVGEGTGYCDWDKIENVPTYTIDTAKNYSSIYRAEKYGAAYYICFDRFGNFNVYNGVYGCVRLKVGDTYGECYITDHDHYAELTRMLESFGDCADVKAPAKDEALDFIQIELGSGSDEITTMTLSADGYCLTDHSPVGEQQVNKYFSLLDKESFVSLVQWVDQVLSEEYVTPEETE
ncbi:MAG: hypothetical protein IK999_00915 [Ruminococcus sp.]|nr:hypothetical protein [Ruminococcus sp.]